MLVECRASGFAGLFDCAKMWHGIHVLGIRSYTGARALLGTGFHAGTAAFDKARMEGAPITIDDAAGAVVDAIAERADECQWRSDDLTRRQVEAKALALHTVYCKDVSPQFEFHAVELTLEPLDVDCGDGVIIRLKGTLDRTRIRRDPAFFDQLGVKISLASVAGDTRSCTARTRSATLTPWRCARPFRVSSRSLITHPPSRPQPRTPPSAGPARGCGRSEGAGRLAAAAGCGLHGSKPYRGRSP